MHHYRPIRFKIVFQTSICIFWCFTALKPNPSDAEVVVSLFSSVEGFFFQYVMTDIHSLNSSCCQSKQTPHSSCGLLFPLTPSSSCPWPSASCRTLWTGSAQQTWRTVFAVKEVFSLSVWSVEQLHFASRVSHLSSAIHRRRVLTPVLKTSNKSQPVSDIIFLDTPPNVACPPASWARRPSPWRADLLFH